MTEWNIVEELKLFLKFLFKLKAKMNKISMLYINIYE